MLSREETQRLWEATLNLKHWVLLMTTYSAGLRVSEIVHLKVSDIDPGTGAKDRYTLLSKRPLTEVRLGGVSAVGLALSRAHG